MAAERNESRGRRDSDLTARQNPIDSRVHVRGYVDTDVCETVFDKRYELIRFDKVSPLRDRNTICVFEEFLTRPYVRSE